MTSPLPISRRIAVVGVSGGAGVSVLVGRMSAAIAARSEGRVLLVDAVGKDPSAAWHAGVLGDRFRRPADRVPAAGKLDVLTLGGDLPSTNIWWAEASERQRASTMSVTDWGSPNADLVAEITALSHVVVVCARADRNGAQRALDMASDIEALGDCATAIVLSDISGTAHPAMARIAELMPIPTTCLPHDRSHGRTTHLPLHRLRGSTRLALLRAAAMTLRRAAASRTSARRQVRAT